MARVHAGLSCALALGLSQVSLTASMDKAHSRTLFVDARGGSDSSGRRGKSDFPFQTIAKAETLACPSDTILLRPGTHALSSALIITKPKLRITGRGARIIGPTSDAYFLCLNADHISLVGVEVDGCRGNNKQGGVSGAIYVGAKDNRIANCSIHGMNRYAIQVGDGAQDTLIEHNHIYDCFGGVVGDTGKKAARAFRRLRVLDNKITDAFVEPSTPLSGGVKLHSNSGHYSARCIIRDNYLYKAGEVGIEAQGGVDELQISRNSVYGSGIGISLDTIWSSSVMKNRVSGSTYIGLEAAGDARGDAYVGNLVDSRDESGKTASSYSFSGSNSPPPSHLKISHNTFLYGSFQFNSASTFIDIISNKIVSASYAPVSLSSSHVNLRNNTVRSEVARGGGGCFVFLDATSRDIDDVVIANNSFGSSTGSFGSGAGLQFYIPGQYNVTNVSVIDNVCDGTTFPSTWTQQVGGGTGFVRFKQNDPVKYGSGSF